VKSDDAAGTVPQGGAMEAGSAADSSY